MTLDEIIEGCKNNNQRCYTKLYDMYRPKLLLVIKQYFKDIDTVEELLQQTFIKVYEKIDKYTNTGSFQSWLVMIAKNSSIDYYRKHKEDDELTDNLNFNPYSEEQLNVDIEVNSNLIKEYINQLTPSYKEVFDLFVIQEYQHKEIAEMLGITVGSSKSNLFKAKNKIKKMLNSKFEFN